MFFFVWNVNHYISHEKTVNVWWINDVDVKHDSVMKTYLVHCVMQCYVKNH